MNLRFCRKCGAPHTSSRKQNVCPKCRWFERKPYRQHMADVCAFCGFKPVDICQLSVDHINGNHDDNRPSNLQTLCLNCHSLKTKVSGDYIPGNINNLSMQMSMDFTLSFSEAP